MCLGRGRFDLGRHDHSSQHGLEMCATLYSRTGDVAYISSSWETGLVRTKEPTVLVNESDGRVVLVLCKLGKRCLVASDLLMERRDDGIILRLALPFATSHKIIITDASKGPWLNWNVDTTLRDKSDDIPEVCSPRLRLTLQWHTPRRSVMSP